MADAERSQYLGDRLHQIFVIDTEQEKLRFCGICEGTKNIENSPESEFPADRSDIFHCRMIFLGKHETKTGFGEELSAQIGILLDVDAERFETVRRPALGRGCPVAVLCDLDARRRDDHGGSRRNVEGIGIVTAGSDDLQHLHAGMLYRCRMAAHGYSAS